MASLLRTIFPTQSCGLTRGTDRYAPAAGVQALELLEVDFNIILAENEYLYQGNKLVVLTVHFLFLPENMV
jgi:hypothetical protein